MSKASESIRRWLDGGAYGERITDTATLLEERDELLEALEDVMAQAGGRPKSCGHDFYCVCPGDKARAAIAKAKGE